MGNCRNIDSRMGYFSGRLPLISSILYAVKGVKLRAIYLDTITHFTILVITSSLVLIPYDDTQLSIVPFS